MALWTDEEISLLRTYYEDHGAYWYDWADILPSRPSGSIYYTTTWSRTATGSRGRCWQTSTARPRGRL